MLIVRTFVLASLVLAVARAPATADDIYNHIGIVHGQVFILNNPELGRTPASGQYFVLQRMDCRRCLVGVRADVSGRYTVFLGVGRYRLICSDPERDGTDLLRQGQVREVVVKPRPSDVELNIELNIARAP